MSSTLTSGTNTLHYLSRLPQPAEGDYKTSLISACLRVAPTLFRTPSTEELRIREIAKAVANDPETKDRQRQGSSRKNSDPRRRLQKASCSFL